jgi:serine/threonine-protein kinase
VPSTGGTAAPLTSLLDGEINHRWPQVLPADRGLLYVSNTSDNWDDARVMVQPLPTGTPKIVQPGFYGRYVASGHLLYVKGGTIYAAPFDLNRLEVTGPSVAAVPQVVADATTGGAQFSASQTGTLVYLQGQTFFRSAPMAWMDRGGTTVPMPPAPSNWGNPRISPDGKQVAYDIHDGKQSDVWVLEVATGKPSRLTFDRSDESNPVWTADGQRITFTSTRDGAPNLYWQRADGTGGVQRLTTSRHAQTAGSWHPNGKVLAFQEVRPDTRSDVVLLELNESGGEPKPGRLTTFAGTAAQESEPAFSSDGRWLAYHGNETGRAQVFVRPLQGAGKWQISTTGGRDATWGRTRPELLFFGFTEGRIMTAPFNISGGSFRHEVPRAWSNTQIGRPARPGRTFDLHLDGERVVVVPADRQSRTQMMLVLNFFEQLRQNPAGAQ